MNPKHVPCVLRGAHGDIGDIRPSMIEVRGAEVTRATPHDVKKSLAALFKAQTQPQLEVNHIHLSTSSSPSNITIMTKQVSKVIYKPDSQSTDEFTVIVNPVEVRRPPRIIRISITSDTTN